MIIIGHRGAAGYEPENTLRSVQRAIDISLKWTEIDIQEVGGSLYVLHDRTVDRTTNGKGSIEQLSAAEIRSFDAGQGECIPFLSEVLRLVNGKIGLNIELKGGAPVDSLIEEIQRWITRENGSPEALLLSSFNHQWLKVLKVKAPHIPLAPLVYGVPHDLAACVEPLGSSMVNVDRKYVTKEFVEDAHRRGAKVVAYTVNEVGEAQRLNAMGIDGIFSDFPDRFVGM